MLPLVSMFVFLLSKFCLFRSRACSSNCLRMHACVSACAFGLCTMQAWQVPRWLYSRATECRCPTWCASCLNLSTSGDCWFRVSHSLARISTDRFRHTWSYFLNKRKLRTCMNGISMICYPFILQMCHLRSCRFRSWQCILWNTTCVNMWTGQRHGCAQCHVPWRIERARSAREDSSIYIYM